MSRDWNQSSGLTPAASQSYLEIMKSITAELDILLCDISNQNSSCIQRRQFYNGSSLEYMSQQEGAFSDESSDSFDSEEFSSTSSEEFNPYIPNLISYPNSMEYADRITLMDKLITSYPVWFQPEMGRADSSRILESKSTGNFIVRQSSRANTLAVTVKLPFNHSPCVQHYLIKRSKQGFIVNGGDKTFRTIPNLVEHYITTADGFPCNLALPLTIAKAKSFQELSVIALMGQEFWTSHLSNDHHWLETNATATPVILPKSANKLRSNQSHVSLQNDHADEESLWEDVQRKLSTAESDTEQMMYKYETELKRKQRYDGPFAESNSIELLSPTRHSHPDVFSFNLLPETYSSKTNSDLSQSPLPSPTVSDSYDDYANEPYIDCNSNQHCHLTDAKVNSTMQKNLDVSTFSNYPIQGKHGSYHIKHSGAITMPRKNLSNNQGGALARAAENNICDLPLDLPITFAHCNNTSNSQGTPDSGFTTPAESMDVLTNTMSSSKSQKQSAPLQSPPITVKPDSATGSSSAASSSKLLSRLISDLSFKYTEVEEEGNESEQSKGNDAFKESKNVSCQTEVYEGSQVLCQASNSNIPGQDTEIRVRTEEKEVQVTPLNDTFQEFNRKKLTDVYGSSISVISQASNWSESSAIADHINMAVGNVFTNLRRSSSISTVFDQPWDTTSSLWNDLKQLGETKHVSKFAQVSSSDLNSVVKDEQKILDDNVMNTSSFYCDSEIPLISQEFTTKVRVPGFLRPWKRNRNSLKKIQDYILDLASDMTTMFGHTVENFVKCTREGTETNPHVVTRNIRQFMTGIKNYLVRQHESGIQQVINNERRKLKKDEFLNVDAIIECCLHKCVLKPLKQHIYKCYVSDYTRKGNVRIIEDNIQDLITKSTQEMGIKTCLLSPEAISLEVIKHFFIKMQNCYSPMGKLENLLKAIAATISSMEDIRTDFHKPSIPEPEEIVPVLVYVIVQCELTAVELEVEYMWALLNPVLLLSEAGYYLSIFSCAVHLLKSSSKTDIDFFENENLDKFNCLLKIAYANEDSNTVTTKTLPTRPNMNIKEIGHLVALLFEVQNSEDYNLYLLLEDAELQLGPTDCPQKIRSELDKKNRQFMLVYKRKGACVAWPHF